MYTNNENCGCAKGDVIKGITCDVKNCHYHDGESHCLAGHINVGPRNADTSSETLCATFKPKIEG